MGSEFERWRTGEVSSGLQRLQVCRFVIIPRTTVLANGLIGVPSGSDRHWSEQANVQIPTCRRCFGVCSHAQAPKWSWLEPPPLVAGGIFQQAVKAIRKLIFLVSQEMRKENVFKASLNVLQVYYHPESVTYGPSIWSLRLANPKHPDPMVCIPNLLSYQPKQTGDHTPNNTSNRVYLSPSLRT